MDFKIQVDHFVHMDAGEHEKTRAAILELRNHIEMFRHDVVDLFREQRHDAVRARHESGAGMRHRLFLLERIDRRIEQLIGSQTKMEMTMKVNTDEMVAAVHAETDAVKGLVTIVSTEPDRTAAAVLKALNEADVNSQEAQRAVDAARDESKEATRIALEAAAANTGTTLPAPIPVGNDSGSTGSAATEDTGSADSSDSGQSSSSAENGTTGSDEALDVEG